MITQEELKNRLNYNELTGEFTWINIINHCNRRIGDVAGYLRKDGYIQIQIDKKLYLAHRLAFLYMKGNIPKYVDHIDRNKKNNKWKNLRETTYSQNKANTEKRKNNTSGYKGVVFSKKSSINPWIAQIGYNNTTINIGSFPTEIDAALAYDKKILELQKEFACLNFPVKGVK